VVTADIYAYVTPGMQREAGGAVDAFWQRSAG
jgi:hypothetical protein